MVTSQLLSIVKLEASIKEKMARKSARPKPMKIFFLSNRNYLSFDKQTIWKLANHDEDQHTSVIIIDIGSICWS